MCFSNIYKFVLILMTTLFSPLLCASEKTAHANAMLDTVWKQKIYAYAQDSIKHSAWGFAHSERDYQMALIIAKKEKLNIDTDVLFAAAFLHDIGAIDEFKKKDVEHSARSIEIIQPLLMSYGFPMQKWPKVKAAVLGHMYYANKPKDNEAIVLHDADALDFLGAVGIMRIISVTEKHRWATDLSVALKTLQQFKVDLPNTLITDYAKNIAKLRVKEMDEFFSALSSETFNNNLL